MESKCYKNDYECYINNDCKCITVHDLDEYADVFAIACYNNSTICELDQALIDGPDLDECAGYEITETEWIAQIKKGLSALKHSQEKN
jgi:hypothetical protein